MIALQQSHNVNSLNGDENAQSAHEAQMLADVICDFNETFKNEENFTNLWQTSCEEEDNNFSEEVNELFRDKTRHEQHAQQHTLEKGLRKHGKAGEDTAPKEMGQLHDRQCFELIRVEDMTEEEKCQAQMALTHLTEKRDETIKGRTVHNGKPTGEWSS